MLEHSSDALRDADHVGGGLSLRHEQSSEPQATRDEGSLQVSEHRYHLCSSSALSKPPCLKHDL